MQVIEFNRGWLFQRGETLPAEVSLPHDAMLAEKRNTENASGSGGAFYAGNQYTYLKDFFAPEEWREKIIRIHFEGIYKDAAIFVNKKKIAQTHYGYTEYRIRIDQYLNCGQNNQIQVEIDHTKLPDSRWYSGAGLYRPVTMEILNKKHIVPESVYIETLSTKPAKIRIHAEHTDGIIRARLAFDNEIIAELSFQGNEIEFEVSKARFWNADAPYLYECKLYLEDQGVIVDEIECCFGIRMIEWNSSGLRINGEETLLRGGCVHSDNGILGASSYAESEWRRIKKLKEYGFNAIRSAHNPCSRAMLEACDYYGMYVIDEMWDMWYQHKTKYDYASDIMQHYEEDICSAVQKDRNHPCVLAYSIGNEISEPASEKGLQFARILTDMLHRSDSKRPVTAGINLMIIAQASQGNQMYGEDGQGHEPRDMSGMDSQKFNEIAQKVGNSMNHAADSDMADAATSPILDMLDIAGYNYASGRYSMEGEKHPDRLIYGSETFPQDLPINWKMVKKYPWLIGDFMWTAWDYLGETGAGAWAYTDDAKAFAKPYPWLLSETGIVDILGNPTGEAFHTKAVWEQEECLHIAVQPVNRDRSRLIKSSWRGSNAIPSWSFYGCEGKEAIVEVYSKESMVELILNGKSLGRKKVQDYKAEYRICYESGMLEAVEYKSDEQIGETVKLISAVSEYKLQILAEEKYYKDDDIIYFQIQIVGENGVIESNMDERIKVKVDGGEMLAFGSANPRTEENFLSGQYSTYYGQSQLVARKTDEVMTVLVIGETLQSISITV